MTWLHVACLHLQAIEIPFLKVTKKVKSMQMFRESVQSAKQVLIGPFTPIPTLSVLHMHTHTHTRTHTHTTVHPQGDRVGICVTQFDPKQVERCLVCSPGCLPTLYGQSPSERYNTCQLLCTHCAVLWNTLPVEDIVVLQPHGRLAAFFSAYIHVFILSL